MFNLALFSVKVLNVLRFSNVAEDALRGVHLVFVFINGMQSNRTIAPAAATQYGLLLWTYGIQDARNDPTSYFLFIQYIFTHNADSYRVLFWFIFAWDSAYR